MIFLNGKIVNADEQFSSFALYNTGVFTTLAVDQNNQILGWDLHINRLTNDAQQLFSINVSRHELISYIRQYLDVETIRPLALKITLFPHNINLARPEQFSQLNFLITSRSMGAENSAAIKLKSVIGKRALADIKTTNIAPNLFYRAKARQAGFDDALLIENNLILEGPTWNIFFIKDKVLYTPRLNGDLLPGVTRALLLQICEHENIDYVEDNIFMNDLSGFNSCFVSSSVQGVRTVASIDSIQYNPDNQLQNLLHDKYLLIQPEDIN